MTDPKQEPLLDEDGNPYEPYTQAELDIMWETHYPQAEDGDSWFTGRWLATVKELQGRMEDASEELATVHNALLAAKNEGTVNPTALKVGLDMALEGVEAAQEALEKEGTK